MLETGESTTTAAPRPASAAGASCGHSPSGRRAREADNLARQQQRETGWHAALEIRTEVAVVPLCAFQDEAVLLQSDVFVAHPLRTMPTFALTHGPFHARAKLAGAHAGDEEEERILDPALEYGDRIGQIELQVRGRVFLVGCLRVGHRRVKHHKARFGQLHLVLVLLETTHPV